MDETNGFNPLTNRTDDSGLRWVMNVQAARETPDRSRMAGESGECPSAFWDALAPYHARIEDNYLDRRSARRILHEVRGRVLVVGAGQGLIVAELIEHGFECDGVDLSSEMVRFAASRRGLNLVRADARAMPVKSGRYETVIYATGVIDFMGEDEVIRAVLKEGRRVATERGKIFVAFYRISPPLVKLLKRVGLVSDGLLYQRQTLEIQWMSPWATIAWVAKRAGTNRLHATGLLLASWAFSTIREKKAAFNVQRVLSRMDNARRLIDAAPEKQPYRGEPEIRSLFDRLGIGVKGLRNLDSCYLAQI